MWLGNYSPLLYTAISIFVASSFWYLYRCRETRSKLASSDDAQSQRTHGGSIVGEVLAAWGIKHIFTLCGGHISPILQGATDNGVKVIDLRDERSATFAADAASRMTGKPGVVVVTAGPGVTNAVTAVKNAAMAQQPLLIIGGATATMLRGRGALQDIDQMSLMAPLTKWCVRASRVGNLRALMERALTKSFEGVPGPVFVEIAVDLLYPEEVVNKWYMKQSGIKGMKGPVGSIAKKCVDLYLWYLFRTPCIAGASHANNRSKYPANVSVGERRIKKVARALTHARKPVLVIGNQAMVNLDEEDASLLAKAVKQLGLPTFLGGGARGLLGRESKLQFRHGRTKALREADLVILAGFPLDFRLGYGVKINRRATLISANLDLVALKKNRRPTYSVRAHPAHFLQQLASTDIGKPEWSAWFKALEEREAARDSEIMAKTSHSGTMVDPIYLFKRIEEKLSDDSILVLDGGDFVATGSYILQPRRPLSWLDPGVFGTLGVGGGFAVGAAASRPKATVWIFYGDGSSAYSLSEFDTFRRLGFAPIAVIGNDASWQQIARDQIQILGTDVGTVLRRSDYHLVAEGYGGKGLALNSHAELDNVLDEAIKLSSEGHAVCINVHLKRSDFREGSISI